MDYPEKVQNSTYRNRVWRRLFIYRQLANDLVARFLFFPLLKLFLNCFRILDLVANSHSMSFSIIFRATPIALNKLVKFLSESGSKG